MSSTFARIVLTTAANPEEAQRIARTLVEERLAACAPLTLACMHGSAWRGDGGKLLLALAEVLSK